MCREVEGPKAQPRRRLPYALRIMSQMNRTGRDFGGQAGLWLAVKPFVFNPARSVKIFVKCAQEHARQPQVVQSGTRRWPGALPAGTLSRASGVAYI
jgi:hypothetical protein